MTDASEETPARPATRRWLRPSLRASMALVLVLGILLARFVNGARAQREAVAAIERAGGEVMFDHEYKNHVMIFDKPRGFPWLRRHLGPEYFDRAIMVSLQDSRDADALMPHVAALGSLEELRLIGSSATDAGLAHLQGLTNLREFSIDQTKATSASFKYFRGMRRLGGVGVGGIPCDDAGLAELCRLPATVSICLADGSPITDAGLAPVARLPGLLILILNGSRVGDAGLRVLDANRELQAISLNGTDVTGAGLARLARLPKLRAILAKGTRATDAEVDALARAYPKIRFIR